MPGFGAASQPSAGQARSPVAGRFTATDEETPREGLTVSFTGNSNADGYYTIVDNNVVLTQKGADFVNAGNQLPKIDLTVTDPEGLNRPVTPGVAGSSPVRCAIFSRFDLSGLRLNSQG
ncbi:hypothetical protein [Pseudomonas marginalis]|uniref:hypothetical protein n=1 Tax=Pseudomonas marginalis TaxID=298 RepID=UPI00248011C0|nr:hypothetical protein [Pseudomonas marginalis]WGT28261.1 hypothetical protein QGQ83_00005 [Pseudomonas marginalis]